MKITNDYFNLCHASLPMTTSLTLKTINTKFHATVVLPTVANG